MSNISTEARRISRALNSAINRSLSGNGKLVFGTDGSGGAWYSDGAYGFGADTLVFPVPWKRVTAREIQDRLDAMDCD